MCGSYSVHTAPGAVAAPVARATCMRACEMLQEVQHHQDTRISTCLMVRRVRVGTRLMVRRDRVGTRLMMRRVRTKGMSDMKGMNDMPYRSLRPTGPPKRTGPVH